jgi:hypothetical protein
LREPIYLRIGETLSYFELVKNILGNIEKQGLVYDTIGVIGVIGGSLGLFLGFLMSSLNVWIS